MIKTNLLFKIEQSLILMGFLVAIPLSIVYSNVENTNLKYLFFSIPLIFYLIISNIRIVFLHDNNQILKGFALFNQCFYKKQINLINWKKITILNSKKSLSNSHKGNGHEVYFHTYDLTLLNEKHTKKKRIIIFDNAESAEELITFFTNHSSLKREIYCPDFS